MSLSKFATIEDYYKHRAAELEKQNAELLEALEMFVNNSSVQTNFPFECEKAEALIAKHGGGV